jgi:hypothetical protein
MFDAERYQKLMEITQAYVKPMVAAHEEKGFAVMDMITKVLHAVFYVHSDAAIYDVIRVILANIFVAYVLLRGFVMNQKRIDIALNVMNYLFYSYIWPVFFVYFAFACFLPSPGYQTW